MIIRVQVFPTIGHVVRAELVVVLYVPYCAISSSASVQNVLTDDPLSVAENGIAVCGWGEEPTLTVDIVWIHVVH